MRYNITMKDGTKYDNVIVCDEKGQLDSGLFSILRDDPNVYFRDAVKDGANVHNVPLFEIQSAFRQGEFLGSWMATVKGEEELPVWISYYITYTRHKDKLDPLPMKEKAALARTLRKEDLNKVSEILSRGDLKCHPRL
jgi:hypothetical protein